MSFKELRQETKALFKTSQAHPYIAAIVMYLLLYAGSAAVQFILIGSGALRAAVSGSANMVVIVCIYILLCAAYFIFIIWAQLSLCWYYVRMSRRQSAGDSYKMAFKALPGYIVYTILCSLIMIGFILIPVIITIILAAADVPAVITAVLAAAIFVMTVYISLTFAFYPNCYYDRNEKTIMQTLKSNFQATKGHKLQILKLMIIYYIPIFVIYGIVLGLFAYLIIQNTAANDIVLGALCMLLPAFILLAVYMIWMLPNILTGLCIMYNNITGYMPEPEQGDIVAAIEEEE